MIKELTRQECAKKLAEEGYFEGYYKYFEDDNWYGGIISGVDLNINNYHPIYLLDNDFAKFCGIEIPDEYEPYPDDICPDLKCGDVIINKADNIKHLVSAIDERNLNTKHIRIDEGWIIDNEALFNCYVKSDGTPIGRLKGKVMDDK